MRAKLIVVAIYVIVNFWWSVVPAQAQTLLYHVATNAALQTLPSTVASEVVRDGYANTGDAPPLIFIASSSPCSKNSGVGDGGSQTQSSDGKCWLANYTTDERDVREFGAKCDGATNDLPAYQNAVASFPYAGGSVPVPTVNGGTVLVPTGCKSYLAGTLYLSGYSGLTLKGSGLAGDFQSALSVGTGNYPVIDVLGTYNLNTLHLTIEGLSFLCGGAGNANAHGIVEAYVNTGVITHNYFLGCRNGVDLTGVWQLRLDENRWDGGGTQQNYTCLWMHPASDASDVYHNNAVIAHHNICQGQSTYGARIENGAGSIFDHNQWMGGTTGIYYCDPTSTNADGSAVICQFTFWDQDQVDTTSGPAWVFKKGSASALGKGVIVQQPWAGNSNTEAFDIEGASGLSVLDAEIQSSDYGLYLNNDSGLTIRAHIGSYDQKNNGDAAIFLTGNSSSNNLTWTAASAPGAPAIGYNGYAESSSLSQSGNRLYGGPSSCQNGLVPTASGYGSGVSLGFGSSSGSVGMTYASGAGPTSSGQCWYEIKGASVHLQALISLSTLGSSTGNAGLYNLPAAAAPSSEGAWAYSANGSVLATSGFSGLTSSVVAGVSPGSTAAYLYEQGATGYVNLTNANFSNSSTLLVNIDYLRP